MKSSPGAIYLGVKTLSGGGSLERKIRQFIRSRIDHGVYSGAAIIFGNASEKIVSVYEGHLTANSSTPISESTFFDLQSITKALSTTLIFLSLSNDGVFSLENLIDDFLPEGAPKNLSGQGINFKHLLTHSSGLSDSSLEGDFKSTFDIWNHMFSAPLQFKPGSGIEYSDLGYRILGKLIECRTNENLENLFRHLVIKNMDTSGLSYLPNNPFNVAGTPDAHGIIDDEQVHALGGVLGCDGLFGSAISIFSLITEILKKENSIVPNFIDLITTHSVEKKIQKVDFFELLSMGSKTLGWEINSSGASYAGRFHSSTCFEKAGGAGTFVWFDTQTKQVFVYLTNHGKPKPFNEENWNQLLSNVAPDQLSNLIYENI